jgi:hypothetical protein
MLSACLFHPLTVSILGDSLLCPPAAASLISVLWEGVTHLSQMSLLQWGSLHCCLLLVEEGERMGPGGGFI